MRTAADRHASIPAAATRLLASAAALSLVLAPLGLPAAAAVMPGDPRPVTQPVKPVSEIQQAFEAPTAGSTPPASTTPPAQSGQTGPAGHAAPAAPGAQAGNSAPAIPGTTSPTADEAPAEIVRDMAALPAPVARLRQQLIEAAATGDIEKLRPLTGSGPDQTQVMNSEGDDPIEVLKSLSGDPDGQEILAILIDLLSTGAARFEAGKPDEVYVWPYFAGKPLASLTPPERVDLLRIVTAGDLMGMEESGSYNFYRLGITPGGKWKFVAGGD